MEKGEELTKAGRKTDQRCRQESGLGGGRKFKGATPSAASNAVKSRVRITKKSLMTLGSKFSRKKRVGDLDWRGGKGCVRRATGRWAAKREQNEHQTGRGQHTRIWTLALTCVGCVTWEESLDIPWMLFPCW